ncbi:MAG: glycosyltransferase family 2 protein [Moorea sp. SIO2B7]|nr:glycosyltransferase family 2 protein [Moorena sp. SIO2B7]
MKFSIVITTYNRLPLLRRAIDTALNQTIPCEVIVVDDCSSDGTQEYVKSLCESLDSTRNNSLIYHRNPRNLGHSASVNAGVAKATGDWIKAFDDDDYIAPNCIEVISEAIALHPQAVICSCQAAQVDENEVEISQTRIVGPGKAFYIPQEDIHYGMLLELVPFGTTIQVAFLREAFLKSGGWDSGLDTNFDDIDSWVKISRFGDAIFINQCLTYRTIWPGEYNQKFSLTKRLNTNILVKKKIYTFVDKQHQDKTPSFHELENYLKLHWTVVAIKQGKFISATKTFFPAIFLPSAWKLLLNKASISSQFHYLSKSKSIYFKKKTSPNPGLFNLKKVEFIRKYLHLRWGLKSFQEGKIINGIKAFISATFSLINWHLLLIATFPKFAQQRYLVEQQLKNNIVVMERIYSLVSEKHKESLPNLHEIQNYLEIRSFLLSFKEGKVFTAIKFALPTLLSPVAWRLLVKISCLHKLSDQQSLIRRFVLIN